MDSALFALLDSWQSFSFAKSRADDLSLPSLTAGSQRAQEIAAKPHAATGPPEDLSPATMTPRPPPLLPLPTGSVSADQVISQEQVDFLALLAFIYFVFINVHIFVGTAIERKVETDSGMELFP